MILIISDDFPSTSGQVRQKFQAVILSTVSRDDKNQRLFNILSILSILKHFGTPQSNVSELVQKPIFGAAEKCLKWLKCLND